MIDKVYIYIYIYTYHIICYDILYCIVTIIKDSIVWSICSIQTLCHQAVALRQDPRAVHFQTGTDLAMDDLQASWGPEHHDRYPLVETIRKP